MIYIWILVVLIIIILTWLIYMNLNCDISEGFKVSDNKKNTITLSMIVDMNVKIDMIKSVLSNIKLKISRNLNNELKKPGSSIETNTELSKISNKLLEIEKYENTFMEKLEEIENIKDDIFSKIPEKSINNIDELTKLEIKIKEINQKLIDISVKEDLKEDVNNDLEKLDPYVIYLKNVLLDIIKIGV